MIGHAYRVLVLYRVATAMKMSLDTAVAFGLVAAGFLAARPKRGLMTVLTGQTLGGAMARRLLPMAFLIPFVLGALLLM